MRATATAVQPDGVLRVVTGGRPFDVSLLGVRTPRLGKAQVACIKPRAQAFLAGLLTGRRVRLVPPGGHPTRDTATADLLRYVFLAERRQSVQELLVSAGWATPEQGDGTPPAEADALRNAAAAARRARRGRFSACAGTGAPASVQATSDPSAAPTRP